ncbi:MAG TPA: sugar phosphate isomerase/epimerase [Candidatus Limnocylindrales bacterium]
MNELGVQLYSVREAMAAGTPSVLRRLADIGYRVVEPTLGLLGDDPQGFRRLLDAHGLTACALHAPLLGPMRDEVARAALALGVETVVVPTIQASEFATAAGVARSAARLAEAAEWLTGQGLRLAYHNHHWELAQHPSGQPGLELLAALLPDEVGLELDVYWAHVGGADVPALLGRFGDRVRLLHVKDGPATVDDPMTAVGAGVVPIPEILAAAPPSAVRIVEIDRCDGDMFTALADSYGYLDGLSLGAGAAR